MVDGAGIDPFSRSVVMNAPRRYNFFELPNPESTRQEPVTRARSPACRERFSGRKRCAQDKYEGAVTTGAPGKCRGKSRPSGRKTLAKKKSKQQTRAAIAEHQRAQKRTVQAVPRSLGAAVDAAHRFGWFLRLQAGRAEPRVQSTGRCRRASTDRRRGVARAQIR